MSAIVENIDPATAKNWLDAGEAVLIDIREVHEHHAERIPGTALNAMSRFDVAALPQNRDQRLVLYCRSGARSMNLASQLVSAGYGPIYNLEGGIIRWRQEGLPTEPGAQAGQAPGRSSWWPFGR